MALPGETVGLKKSTQCTDCGNELPLLVTNTPAGYYLGFICPECGPYSRETGYMTKEEAESMLEELQSRWRII